MNCANHPDIEKAAFCRTCGKPLCANCTREVKGVIYCENCIAERLQGVQPTAVPPAAGFVSPAPVPGTPGSGPNPTVAGILAGFFPFGVGAVYCGQYAKGLAHLVVFTLLVWGESVVDNGGLNAILGIGIAFFYVWQIIDSVRTARAIQLGQPAPDPFGLAQAFGAAPPAALGQPVAAGQETQRTQSKIPSAAILLIGLGLLFLLQTAGVFEFNTDLLWPLILIALGLWLFAKRWGVIGSGYDRYGRSYRMRGLTGPALLVTLGFLIFIEHLNHGPSFHRTWPVLLLVIGITKLLERGGAFPVPPMPQVPPMPPMPPTPSRTTAGSPDPSAAQGSGSEVKNG
jgi:hypothetical protein